MTKLIHDLLELPEAVRKGDFVQGLTDGIAKPEATLRDYAITPKILQSFQKALSILKSALDDNRSQAAYLDGSFGSGKSHFMAVLALMLADEPTPWRRPELHPLREPHPWIGHKKLVQLPIHMLDAQDMESKILGLYVRWVAEHHPSAAVPAVYVDEGLFEDARRLRSRMGDEAFFADLNSGVQQAASGWGKRATATHWSAASFEAAVASAYLGEEDRDAQSPRARLFSDLVRSFFSSWTQQRSRFVDLDSGLGVVSRHAKGLGYDGVVLYLDELILWLAGRAGDLPFVGQEVQKLVKLKEAQDASRAIPIVSFIARQRDLSLFLGAEAEGAIRAQLSRNLSHHEGRFDNVSLADSNLPAIVKHRVVRPRDAEAAEKLEDDFVRTWRAAGQAASVLIGSEGDEAAFRQVYPFSPALVEALVALSDCLQRERTAIRILMELLVHHLPDLELGRVVPVGDAFDALAESEDPIDDPVMRARFERARDLYRNSFLPLIRRSHDTDKPSECQRMRDEHERRLGCSGCPKMACRNDNRLAKTLLMAALVPEAKPFKGLSVKRLVHLNHGSIASPIPGAEMQVAAKRLRDWASQIGALRLGDQADPEVSVHLSGIDLQPILAAAADADKPGARKNTMRRLLFDALGLSADGSIVETEQSYFGTKRAGRVRYGNVREMDDSTLMAEGFEWQLILDYPFDERGFSPHDDLQRVESYREAHSGASRPNPTVIWLPTFFSRELENELGDLVVLEHILEGDTSRYLSHLRVEDQHTTRADLSSLRAQKEALVKRSLGDAYGLSSSTKSSFLDPSRAADEHLVPLLDGLELRSVLAGTMRDGLKQLVDAILSKRYPHHPRFDGPVNASRLERIRALLERLLDTREQRMAVDKGERNELRNYADPLGLTDTGDVAVVLRDRPLQELEQARQQRGLDTPTVGELRSWLDPARTRGLPAEVEELLILTWCAWSGRTLQRGGRGYGPSRLGQLPDDVELVRPELPTPALWAVALERAGQLFGIALSGHALTARNLSALVEKLDEHGKTLKAVVPLVEPLEVRVRQWADASDAPRLTTAQACAALLQALQRTRGAAMVRALAEFSPKTSLSAMARSFTSAEAVHRLVTERSRWIVLEQVRKLVHDAARSNRASLLLEDLAKLLAADEVNQMLADGLSKLTLRAEALLRDAPPPPAPPPPTPPSPAPLESGWTTVLEKSITAEAPSELAEALRALAAEVEQAAAGATELRVELSAVVTRRESKP
ncbi:MAG: hypothetical protein RBU37_16380 [Myxococcota bacterium]|jgi:hypothetical protein|nr:hypothetical protein [Myxococcota bacterium]